MNKIKIFFGLLIISALVFSCVKPPEGTLTVNVIGFLKKILDDVKIIKDDDQKRNDYFKHLMDNFHSILVINKNSSFTFRSREAKPGPDDFAYSLNDNRFIVKKPIYITFEKKDMFFSFDNRIWYSTKTDFNKKIEGIRQEINYDVRADNDSLFLEYDMTFKLGRYPAKAKITKGKDTVTLKKGMILSNTDESLITADLKKTILYVPENTVIAGNMAVEGNIVQSFSDGQNITVKSLSDIFIFMNNNMISVSVDEDTWNTNILSFNINPKFEIMAAEDKMLSFDVKVDANYHKNEVSFSLLALLFNAMR